MTVDHENPGYWVRIPDEKVQQFPAWADLCRLGREAYFRASSMGFDSLPGSEAEYAAHAVESADWPGGPWPVPGPSETLHQVGLMLANAAAGRLGEFGALLDAGEVAWSSSLCTHAA